MPASMPRWRSSVGGEEPQAASGVATNRACGKRPPKNPVFSSHLPGSEADDKTTLPQPASRNGKGTPHDHRSILSGKQPPPEGRLAGFRDQEVARRPRPRRPAGSVVSWTRRAARPCGGREFERLQTGHLRRQGRHGRRLETRPPLPSPSGRREHPRRLVRAGVEDRRRHPADRARTGRSAG